MRFGVINWDCSVPKETTFFGYHATKSLSPSKYRTRTPYYATVLGENEINFTERSDADYDRELEYAIEAGIDYFAYCWYSNEAFDPKEVEGAPTGPVEGKLHEITKMRKRHCKSPLRDKIKLAAILVCSHIYFDSDIDALIEEMKGEHYEKVGDRPLVYLFGGYRTDFIERLTSAAEKNGLKKPFFVFFNNGVTSEDGDYSLADGVSAYASTAGSNSFAELYRAVEKENNERRDGFGLPSVPFFSFGWNPTPRMDNPVPWHGYDELPYHPAASEDEILDAAEKFAAWIKADKRNTEIGHVLSFAWNEFEEGGYICPTFDKNGGIDLTRIRVFAKFRKIIDSRRI